MMTDQEPNETADNPTRQLSSCHLEGDVRKPLGRRAYGHIPHLPGSRLGPGDHHCHPGQAKIVTVSTRDKFDRIFVQEKLDGSCVAVALLQDGNIVALVRAGYLAESSPYEMHRIFAKWVDGRHAIFRRILEPGQRLVGEWIAQAHGTIYADVGCPFVPFDIMEGNGRMPYEQFKTTVDPFFAIPHTLVGPMSVESAITQIQERNMFRAVDPIEGVVYRCERKGKVDFLAKFVRHNKADGSYLPSVTGGAEVWNWRPFGDVHKSTCPRHYLNRRDWCSRAWCDCPKAKQEGDL